MNRIMTAVLTGVAVISLITGCASTGRQSEDFIKGQRTGRILVKDYPELTGEIAGAAEESVKSVRRALDKLSEAGHVMYPSKLDYIRELDTRLYEDIPRDVAKDIREDIIRSGEDRGVVRWEQYMRGIIHELE